METTVHVARSVITLAGAGAIVVTVAAALGFRSATPKESLAEIARINDSNTARTNRRVDSNSMRITALERRFDTVSTKQNFTNYLLCVQLRTTNPVLLPPDCAPIIQSRSTP